MELGARKMEGGIGRGAARGAVGEEVGRERKGNMGKGGAKRERGEAGGAVREEEGIVEGVREWREWRGNVLPHFYVLAASHLHLCFQTARHGNARNGATKWTTLITN